jgi:hypothetical protein
MNETRKTVTLEDLLRVKRAERPPAEFWDQFERGMRTKQLAAIVEPRPWWAPFIRVGARVARYQVPVGAAAILAITFVTIREYRTAEIRPVYEPAIAVATPRNVSMSETTQTVSPVQNGNAEAVAMMVPETPVRSSATLAATGDDAIDDSAPVGVASHLVPAPGELTPSARYIAENFEAARAADPELDQMLVRPTRAVETRTSRTEPLARVNVPGESRRERLLGGATWLAASSTSSDSALRPDPHATRRLTERRLAESDIVSRVDVAGSSVSLKF